MRAKRVTSFSDKSHKYFHSFSDLSKKGRGAIRNFDNPFDEKGIRKTISVLPEIMSLSTFWELHFYFYDCKLQKRVQKTYYLSKRKPKFQLSFVIVIRFFCGDF